MASKKSVKSRPLFERVLTSAVLRVVLACAVIAFFAFFLVWFLECAYFDYSMASGWEYIDVHPEQFYFSVLLVAVWLAGLSALFRSAIQAGGLTWAVFIVVGFINSAKLAVRQTPLLPEDFGLVGEAGSLLQFVDFWEVVKLVLMVIAVVVASCYAGHKIRLFYRRVHFSDLKTGFRRKGLKDADATMVARSFHNLLHAGNVITRLCVIALAVTALIALSEPIRHQNGERYYHLDWLGENSTFEAWNPEKTYTRNGFILGYLYNLEKFNLTAPDDYSRETIEATVARYQAVKQADDQNRTSLRDLDCNIIAVLDESFYDFSAAADYYRFYWRGTATPAEVTPNLRQILSSGYHGTMFSADYGGGTANIEFEILTGLSNYWTNTVPYTDLISSLASLPSLASVTADAGFGTTAMHTYIGGMYKRSLVYPIMGFDNFYDITTLDNIEYSGYYADDSGIFADALAQIADADSPQFIHIVTMQNHTPHDYFAEEDLLFSLSAGEETMGDPVNVAQLENYATMLYYADEALGELIAGLENSDERTAVLFYGDHAPGILNELVNSADLEKKRLAYQTPYFIYANFDLQSGRQGNATKTSTDLGMYSQNCLSNLLYDLLGARKPAFAYLLAEACAEAPILTHTYGDDDGIEELLAGSEVLQAYKMATYDLLGGEQYWLSLGGF